MVSHVCYAEHRELLAAFTTYEVCIYADFSRFAFTTNQIAFCMQLNFLGTL